MKQLKITVNGRAYDVTVEEQTGAAAFVPPAVPTAAPAPVASAAAPAAPAAMSSPTRAASYRASESLR